MKTLIQNGLVTPDGTILTSGHRHDYKTHKDKNGVKYMVDGGLDYCRRTTYIPKEDLVLYKEDSHTKIRNKYVWGTFGKNGDQPYRQVRLKDMTTDHILAVMEHCRISPDRTEIYENELLYRVAGSESN